MDNETYGQKNNQTELLSSFGWWHYKDTVFVQVHIYQIWGQSSFFFWGTFWKCWCLVPVCGSNGPLMNWWHPLSGHKIQRIKLNLIFPILSQLFSFSITILSLFPYPLFLHSLFLSILSFSPFSLSLYSLFLSFSLFLCLSYLACLVCVCTVIEFLCF